MKARNISMVNESLDTIISGVK